MSLFHDEIASNYTLHTHYVSDHGASFSLTSASNLDDVHLDLYSETINESLQKMHKRGRDHATCHGTVRTNTPDGVESEFVKIRFTQDGEVWLKTGGRWVAFSVPPSIWGNWTWRYMDKYLQQVHGDQAPGTGCVSDDCCR